jgi:hypothetical protein
MLDAAARGGSTAARERSASGLAFPISIESAWMGDNRTI